MPSPFRIAPVLLTALGVAAAAFSGAANADQLDNIKAKKTLVCGTFAAIAPFGYPDPKTRETIGSDVELCHAVAKEMGLKAEVRGFPVGVHIPELKLGHIDIIIANMGYTKTRAEQVEFSNAYNVGKEVAVVGKTSGLTNLASLDGKKISSTKGSTSEQSIRIAGANPVTFQDTGSAYMALQQNKVVGLVTNTMTAIKLVNQAGESGVQLALAKEPMALEPIGAGMRLGEPAFLHKVNEALASMEASGEIDAIWDRWIGPNTPYKMVREDKVQSLADLKFDPLP